MKFISLLPILFLVIPVPLAHAQSPEVPADLDLEGALLRALNANPGLRARAFDGERAAGRTRQAGARPNPALWFELENVGGSTPITSEATIGIGQKLELGGKRGARLGAARAEQGVAAADLDSRRSELIAETTTRFVEALAAERLVSLSAQEVRAAEEASATLGERVRAGAAHSVERRRADVELANLRLENVILRSDAGLARARLSSMWNEPEPRFERIVGTLDSLPAEPHLDSLASRAGTSPALTRWTSEREARARRVELERARRIPDLDAQFGVRRIGDDGGTTFVGGVALPLPVFDRNAGSVHEASAALSQASSEEAEARLEIRRSLAEQHAALRRTRTTLSALRTEVLPEAQRAFDDIQVGFERGRFSYLDLLEARRTLLRARREELHALLAAHLSIVAIERLIAAPLVPGASRSGGLR